MFVMFQMSKKLIMLKYQKGAHSKYTVLSCSYSFSRASFFYKIIYILQYLSNANSLPESP